LAVDPQFAAVVDIGAAQLNASVETSLTSPSTTVVIMPAGANGSKIEEIVIHATGANLTTATAAGLVYIFLYDGTNYHLYDTIPITAVTPSTTVAPFRVSRTYTNLFVESGWSLRASQSVSGNVLQVEAFGGDY
jgi:hypothetical protein